MITLQDYILWALTQSTDTAKEDEKIRSLMRKRGFSKSKAIAILKSNGGISKSYGTGQDK